MPDERTGRSESRAGQGESEGDEPWGEAPADGHRPRREESTDDEGNIAGSLRADQPLESGAIDLENAAFLLLGVLFVVLFLGSAIAGF